MSKDFLINCKNRRPLITNYLKNHITKFVFKHQIGLLALNNTFTHCIFIRLVIILCVLT